MSLIIELLEKDVKKLLGKVSDRSTCQVVAKKYGKKHISFECPFCRTKYKKNGEPTKNSKPIYHYHGSMSKYPDNFITHRSPHCEGLGKERLKAAGYLTFEIRITDETIRDENF